MARTRRLEQRCAARIATVAAVALVGCRGGCGAHDEDSTKASGAKADAAASSAGDPLAGLDEPMGSSHGDAGALEHVLFGPPYVVVGDVFGVVGSTSAGCTAHGVWSPPGIVTFVADETIAPKFATPSRTYRAYYRATAPGDASVVITCRDASPTATAREVARDTVTVLSPDAAAPYVGVELGAYAVDLAPALEKGRVGALACFGAELARAPATRAHGTMRVWIDASANVKIPLDKPDYAGTFDGLSETAASCVRSAMSKAVAAQGRIDTGKPSAAHDYLKDHGDMSELRLTFEMRPKAFGADACASYARRWKACAAHTDTSDLVDAHASILARQKVATSDEGRRALAFDCQAEERAVSEACR